MYSIESIEAAGRGIFGEYHEYFKLDHMGIASDILNIAKKLSEMGLLIESEVILLDNPEFVKGYNMAYRNVRMPLNVNYKEMTRVQYACIYALQFEHQPYFDYLKRTLSKNVFTGKTNGDNAYLQYMVADAIGNKEIKEKAKKDFSKSPYELGSVSLYRQFIRTAGFVTKLAEVYPHFDRLRIELDTTGFAIYPLIEFQSDDTIPLQEAMGEVEGYEDRLKDFCSLLDHNGLVLKEKSLQSLHMDMLGDIVPGDVKGSYIDDTIESGYNWKLGLPVWKKENLSFSGTLEDEDEEDEDEDEYGATEY